MVESPKPRTGSVFEHWTQGTMDGMVADEPAMEADNGVPPPPRKTQGSGNKRAVAAKPLFDAEPVAEPASRVGDILRNDLQDSAGRARSGVHNVGNTSQSDTLAEQPQVTHPASVQPHKPLARHADDTGSSRRERGSAPMARAKPEVLPIQTMATEKPSALGSRLDIPVPKKNPMPRDDSPAPVQVSPRSVEKASASNEVPSPTDRQRQLPELARPETPTRRGDAASPVVRVSIGRIEIRAKAEPAPPPPAVPKTKAYRPALTLDDYLKKRGSRA